MFNTDKKENKIVNDQPFKKRILDFIYKERATKEEELRQLVKSATFNHLDNEGDEDWLYGYLAACTQIIEEIKK